MVPNVSKILTIKLQKIGRSQIPFRMIALDKESIHSNNIHEKSLHFCSSASIFPIKFKIEIDPIMFMIVNRRKTTVGFIINETIGDGWGNGGRLRLTTKKLESLTVSSDGKKNIAVTRNPAIVSNIINGAMTGGVDFPEDFRVAQALSSPEIMETIDVRIIPKIVSVIYGSSQKP